MYRNIIGIGLIICLAIPGMAQKGGESTYSFLGMTNAGRVAALGGEIVSIRDGDINLVYHNPALLSAEMDNHLAINYVDHLAGINVGYTGYARSIENIGNFSAGIHYINYGVFEAADELGNDMGTFRSAEYALNLSYSRSIIDTFLTAGVSLKPIFSSLERYNSVGIALDLGLLYYNPGSLTSVGLVFKNMGMQLSTYAGTREQLPFEIQAGITQGLAHAPFRFSVTFQNLERWDLTYSIDDGNDDLSFGVETEKSNAAVFGDKLMRHIVFSTEVLLGKNFHVDIGYNYKRRQEMKVNAHPGTVGFSWGFGFRISKFHLSYGRSAYHLAGGTNHFSLTTNLSDFYRKR